jgi:hypothetical protein
MRVLKRLLVLLFLNSITAQGQDTAFRVEPAVDSVFHADPSTGVTWQDRTVPDSTLQRLHHDDAFWYANADFKKKAEAQSSNTSFWQWLFRQGWLYHLLWFLIIVSFVVVIFIFLLKSNIALFRKKATPISKDNTATSTETIFTINYARALKEAVSANDFATAIRLQYLQTLAALSIKKQIRYKEEYPNSTYLQQLQQSPYYEDFKKLTRHFEYAWYGKFPIPPHVYNAVAQEFVTFKQDMDI